MDETLPPPVPPPPPRRRRGPRAGTRLLFESALIVASVALGFAVSEWRERVADRALADRVLRDVTAEVEANARQMRAQVAYHQEVLRRLKPGAAAADASGWDALTEQMQQGLNAIPMRRAAWDAAVSSGALRVIDYEIAAVLSEIYVLQSDAYGRLSQRAGEALIVPDTFRKGGADAIVAMFRAMVSELEGNERYLLETYEKHLPVLQRAVNAEKS